MSLQVERFVNGVYKQNCYLAGDKNGSALIIDPGSDSKGIEKLVNERNWTLLAIIATHAHFDHVGAVYNLRERFKIPFYLHGNDVTLLKRMNLYKFVAEGGNAVPVPEITYDISKEPDVLKLGAFEVNVLRTPGHTPGGVCFIIEDHIFTGDTILPAGIGRFDLPGGNEAAMADSIESIKALPSDL